MWLPVFFRTETIMYLLIMINLPTGGQQKQLYTLNPLTLVAAIRYRHNTHLFKLHDGEEYARRSHSR